MDQYNDVIDRLGCHKLLEGGGRIPDHGIIAFEIRSLGFDPEQNMDQNLGSKSYITSRNNITHRPKAIRCTEGGIMDRPAVKELLAKTIESIEKIRNSQWELDDAYNTLVKQFSKLTDEPKIEHAGRRKSTPFKAYWCKELNNSWKAMRSKQIAFKKRNGNRTVRMLKRAEYKKAVHAFDKLLRQKKRDHEKDTVDKIAQVNITDPQQFWRMIKTLGPREDKSVKLEMIGEDGTLITDPNKVLRSWKGKYQDLLNPAPSGDTEFKERMVNNLEINIDDLADAEFNKAILASEVERALRKSKNGKAAGIDRITNEVLKQGAMLELLVRLFNLCFGTGMVPNQWLQAIILPIPKGTTSKATDPLSYRGLSLQSCVYKIYSSVLNARLNTYLESQGKIHNSQNGFRKKRGTIDHLYSLTSIVKDKIDKKQPVYACYVDFKKAFDLVDRDLLLVRLNEMGIKGRLLTTIQSLYKETTSSICLNGMLTEWFGTKYGVKQGDNLSPSLFSSFINPLLTEIDRCKSGVMYSDLMISSLAYAYDIILLSESEVGLQKQIQTLEKWCHKWTLNINTGKTKVMHFRNNRQTPRTKHRFIINEQELEVVEQYKYLGIVVDSLLKFTEATDTLGKAAGRGLGGLINKIHHLKNLDYGSYTKLYNSCVTPIMDYGSCCWHGITDVNPKSIDDVQYRAMRYFLGVNRFTPMLGLEGEMGWLPPKYRRDIDMIRYYNRVCRMGEDRLPKQIMKYQIQHNSPWIGKLNDILERVDHNINMIDMVPTNLKAFKIKIEDNWHQTWRYMADDKPKLRTYMKWKECPVPELYTTSKLPKYHRSLITKLALGVLPIRIETGRYEKLPFKDRTCPSCKGNIVETEEHFLFHCPLYASQREQIMPNESDRNWVEIRRKPFSFGRLVNRMWEIRRGLFMKDKEAKEEKYRENWLARQSRATQAEAMIVGVEKLKKQARQKEGERTGAILRLKLNNICNNNAGNKTPIKSYMPNSDEKEGNKSIKIMTNVSDPWRQMVLKEPNNTNIKKVASITSIKKVSSTMSIEPIKLRREMVSEETNNSNPNSNRIIPTVKSNSNNVAIDISSTWRPMVLKEHKITNIRNVSSSTSAKNVSSVMLSESIKLRRQMVLEETNNSNFNSNQVTTNVSSKWRPMVSKEPNTTGNKKVSSITNVKNVSSIMLTEATQLKREMVSKETNNSNFDIVTGNFENVLTEPGTYTLEREMVLKECRMGKKLCKYCKKDGKMYICSGKGCKGPPSTEGGSDK